MPFANNVTSFPRRVRLTNSSGADAGGIFASGIPDPNVGPIAAAAGTIFIGSDGSLWKANAGNVWVSIAGAAASGLNNPMLDDQKLFWGTDSDFQQYYSAVTGLVLIGTGLLTGTTSPGMFISGAALSNAAGAGSATTGDVTIQTGNATAGGAGTAASGTLSLKSGNAGGGATQQAGSIAISSGSAPSFGLRGDVDMRLCRNAYTPPLGTISTAAGVANRQTAPLMSHFSVVAAAASFTAPADGRVVDVFCLKRTALGGAGATMTLTAAASTITAISLVGAVAGDIVRMTAQPNLSFTAGQTIAVTPTGVDAQTEVFVMWELT